MRSLYFAGAVLAASSASAISLNVNSTDSVTNAAQTIASSIIATYSNSSKVPGLFSAPYYWWESGLVWDTMINYWSLTGDSTYNQLVGEALLFQKGPDNDFMPPNQTKSEGNDDQSFWALAAMTAAERGLPIPQNVTGTPTSWAQLAQNVFDAQAARWDESTCRGGLRWQIFPFNNGYNYKNSLTNGNFVQLAARLGLYTGNATYIEWAQNVTQWSIDAGLIARTGAVWDGFDTITNCSAPNHIQWTANAGTYLNGAVHASNATTTLYWVSMNDALYTAANYTFAPNGTLTEIACQSNGNCDTDQLAFRAILARALANMRDMTLDSTLRQGTGCSLNDTRSSANCSNIGTLHENINELLQNSAMGAAAQCSGGAEGTKCGTDWRSSTWDGTQGLGQSLSALEVVLANLPAVQLRTVNSTGSVAAVAGSNGTSSTAGNSSSGTGTGTSTPSSSASVPASLNAAGDIKIIKMAGQIPKNSVWSAMNYAPPRGRCNHKASLLAPACPCLRFMLHPVKAATSFECDGCNHHASFHSLENPTEDAVLRKWAEQEVSDKERQQAIGAAGSKKRKMITQPFANEDQDVMEIPRGWGSTAHHDALDGAQKVAATSAKAPLTRKPSRKGNSRMLGPRMLGDG
ncbi:hypothetical protein LTR85_005983 [Meristemomyces frigidus]|nr:hypothetical protein LTR85_005983 [Meristemomyces frigidus]